MSIMRFGRALRHFEMLLPTRSFNIGSAIIPKALWRLRICSRNSLSLTTAQSKGTRKTWHNALSSTIRRSPPVGSILWPAWLDPFAVEHDTLDTPQRRQIFERVAVNQNKIGELACFDTAQPVGDAEEPRVLHRSRQQRFHRR